MSVKHFFAALLLAPVIIGCSSESADANGDLQESTVIEASEAVIEAEVVATPSETEDENGDYSHIAVPYTQDYYPNLYETWGEEWVNNINAMMPLVVNRVLANPQCDAPAIADLSDEKSIIREKAVFFVDCENKERFYVTQNELLDSAPVEAKQ